MEYPTFMFYVNVGDFNLFESISELVLQMGYLLSFKNPSIVSNFRDLSSLNESNHKCYGQHNVLLLQISFEN